MGIFSPNIKKLVKKRDVEGLFKAMQHSDSQVRWRSAFALDRVGWKAGNDTEKAYYLRAKKEWDDLTEMGGSAVNSLIQALEDALSWHAIRLELATERNPNIIQNVSREDLDDLQDVLWRIGKPAIDPLIQAVRGEKVFLGRRLHHLEHLKLFRKMGEPAVEPLIQLLKDEDSTLQGLAADALGRIGDVRAVEPLIQLLKDEDSTVQGLAADALGRIGDARAIEPLARALHDETNNSHARHRAAYALGNINDERAVEPLLRALKGLEWEIRCSSALALVDQSWSPANATERIYYLFSTMFIGLQGIAQKDWDEIISYGRHSVEPLIKSLHITDIVIFRIKRKYDGSRTPIEALVGWVARNALKEIGKPAVEPLIEALKDNNSRTRRRAASALGEIRDARAAESLTQALEDEDKEVRKAAKKALRRIR